MQVRIKLPVTFTGYGEGKTKEAAIKDAMESIQWQNFLCLPEETCKDITEVKECAWEWKDGGRYKGKVK